MILRTALILFIGCSFLPMENCFAQDGISRFGEIFSKTEKYYGERENYALDVTYEFFGAGNNSPVETLSGRIEKRGQNYYSKIGPTEFIYLDGVFLKINHREKAVMYSRVPNKKMATPIDMTALTDYFAAVEFSGGDSALICEVAFREKTDLPYTKMVMVLDPNDYSIIRQELYLLPGVNYPSMAAGNKKTTEGKMVITFSPKNARAEKDVFDLSNYLKNTARIALSSKLSSYQLYNATQ